jgi:diacylglycerol kinase family enzyme
MLIRAMREEGLNRRPFGVIPFGTGNAFAHAIGIDDSRVAVEALEVGSPRTISIMLTQRRDTPVVAVSLSAGFEAQVLRRSHMFRAWRRYPVSILALGANVARTETGISLHVDGERVVDPRDAIYNAGVYNSPCYARGRVVFPGADPSDDRMDAVVHRTMRGYWRTIRDGIGPELPDRRGSMRRGCTTVRLETVKPIQFDGESAPGGVFECQIEPDAIRVLVPTDSVYDEA